MAENSHTQHMASTTQDDALQTKESEQTQSLRYAQTRNDISSILSQSHVMKQSLISARKQKKIAQFIC